MISSDLVPNPNPIKTITPANSTKHPIETIAPANPNPIKTVTQVIPDAGKSKISDNVKVSKPCTISPIVVECTTNKISAKKLLSFLKRHHIGMNDLGEVLYENSSIANSSLGELFCDLINGTRKTPPENYKEFYKILKNCDISEDIISQNRLAYFKEV